jgi:hypothetical protein
VVHVSTKLFKRGAVLVAGALMTLGVVTTTAGSASAAPSPGVCTGGSILGGVYSSLTVNGDCTVDSGTVVVTGSVNVKPSGQLIAAFAGSNLQVKGNVTVGLGGLLVLGCNLSSFDCETAPGNATGQIGGKLTSNGGKALIIHSSTIKGVVSFTNGGAGCEEEEFSAFEDSNFGSTVSITKVNTCWLGFIRNQVAGSVTYNNNTSVDPSGNEIVGNRIGGDLKCMGNTPPPQAGFSNTAPNLVAGVRTGQCQSTSLP